MNEMAQNQQPAAPLLRMTAAVVAAYLRHNRLPQSELPAMINLVHRSLAALEAAPDGGASPQTPAVPIRRSVRPDYIVCLEDGKKLKMLKRHLRTAYGMTPQQYRAKWGLPADYPMVAPNYARQRSEFAQKIGLGRKTTAKSKRQGRGRRS